MILEVIPTFECCGEEHEEVVRRPECVGREPDEHNEVLVLYEFVVQGGGTDFVIHQVAAQERIATRDHPIAVPWE